MFDFSKKNREAVEQLRSTVETLMRTLAQEREQQEQQNRGVTSTLEEIKQTLKEQAQQIVLLPTDLSQLHTTVAGQAQSMKQQVQAVEQLAQEQGRFREQITDRVEDLAEEIQQMRTPPNFAPVINELSSQMEKVEQVLTEAIKQFPIPPDSASIHALLQSSAEQMREKLLLALQRPDMFPQLRQVTASLTSIQDQVGHDLPQMAHSITDLQKDIEHLASLMGSFAEHPLTSPNGQGRVIQDAIREAVAKTRVMLLTLEQECMTWLNGLEQQMQTIRQDHTETNQRIQILHTYVSPVKENGPSGQEGGENNATSSED